MSVAYVGIGFMYFYATRSYGLHYILLHFNRMVNRYWRIYIWTINGKTQTMASY